jgi:hypothetical protein
LAFPKFETPKDPDDIDDFELSFAEAMAADDAISAVLEVDVSPANLGSPPASNRSDVTVQAQLYSGQSATLWFAAGKPGWRYLIRALVATAGGRTLSRRAYLKVDEL